MVTGLPVTSFEQSSLVSEIGVGSGPYRWKVIVPLMSEVPPDRVDESDRSVPLTPSVTFGPALVVRLGCLGVMTSCSQPLCESRLLLVPVKKAFQ